LELVHNRGRLGYISSGTFARGNFAKPFRKYLPQHAQLETIIDFGENQPFKGAEMVRPSIVILSKGKQIGDFQSLFIEGTSVPSSLTNALNTLGVVSPRDTLDGSIWVFGSKDVSSLKRKVLTTG